MNRSNVGNVVTNGMQILSVGATTAKRVLGKQNQALNNLSKQEQKDYFEMKSNKMRDEIANYNNPNTEQNNLDDVDSLMGNAVSSYKQNSDQIDDITQKIDRDTDFISQWLGKKQDNFMSPDDKLSKP